MTQTKRKSQIFSDSVRIKIIIIEIWNEKRLLVLDNFQLSRSLNVPGTVNMFSLTHHPGT